MKKLGKRLTDITYPRVRARSDSLSPELVSIQENQESNFEKDLQQLYSVRLPNNNNCNIMADALRATVTLLKTFDGNPARLESFINQIDTFHARYFNNDVSQQEYVLLAIKSKLLNSAEELLLTRPDLQTWDQIKLALRQKFSDPITRTNLQQQLIFLTRKNESVQDYILKLKALVTQINNKICTEILNAEARAILIAQNELTATQNLLSNVPNDLRTLLIVQNPPNLDVAIEIISNYEILTSQNSFKNNFLQNMTTKPKQPNHTFLNNLPKPMNFQPPFWNNFQKPTNFRPPFPSQPININPQPVKHHFPTAQQVFGIKPKTNINQFKPLPPKIYPQPMSGVSIQPRRPPSQIRPQFNNQPYRQQYRPPQFTFQELTHLENEQEKPEYSESDYYPENSDYYPDYYPENSQKPFPGLQDNYSEYVNDNNDSPEEQLENFRLTASEIQNPVSN